MFSHCHIVSCLSLITARAHTHTHKLSLSLSLSFTIIIMTKSSAWSDFVHFLNEEDKSVEVNEVTFWILAGLYGVIALGMSESMSL